jgi:hypothetical protein
LAERWNGSRWSIEPTVDPEGAEASDLAAVSCAPTEECMAVGSYSDSNTVVPLAEGWNGMAWTIVGPPPVPPAAVYAQLAAISCPSINDCVAVGSYYDGITNVPLAEGWDGSAWSIETAATLSGVQASALYGVSCPAADDCTAVGDYADTTGTWSLVEHFNGSKWLRQRAPVPDGSQGSALNAVACSTVSRCTAVGESSNVNGTFTLALVSIGSTWTLETTPNPPASFTSVFSAVSCPSPSTCTAVGYTSGGLQIAPLAEGWDGSAWTIQTAAQPASASNAVLTGVSCLSGRDCIAVGSYDNFNETRTLTLAERWTGSKWATQTTPNPARAEQSHLESASCTPLGLCVATGRYALTSLTLPLPLAEVYKT